LVARKKLAVLALVVVVLVGGVGFVLYASLPPSTQPTITCNSSPAQLTITENGTVMTTVVAIPPPPCGPQVTLQGFSLCASSCIYPSPYLSGTVMVKAASPLSTLLLYINGTYEGSWTYSNNLTTYAIAFKASPVNPSMPIEANDTYTIKFVAFFGSGLGTEATAQVVAGS